MGTAIAYIGLNQDKQVDAAVKTLMTDFAGHSGLGKALFIIGEEYFVIAREMAAQGNSGAAKANYAKAFNI